MADTIPAPPLGFMDDALTMVAPSPQASAPTPAPPEGFLEDAQSVQAPEMEAKYGGPLGEAAAALAGAARAVSLSGSDWLLTQKYGMNGPLVNPQTLEGLAKTNPKSTFIGEAGGLIGAHFIGTGEAEDALLAAKTALSAAEAAGDVAKIAEASKAINIANTALESKNIIQQGVSLLPNAVSKVGKAASGLVGGGLKGAITAGMAEGALFGASGASSEAAIGDHEFTAEHLAASMGMGSILGGGLGALGYGATSLGKYLGILDNTANKATEAVQDINTAVPNPPVKKVEIDPDFVPKSIDDMQEYINKKKIAGETTDLPQMPILEGANARVTLDPPIVPFQWKSLASQGEQDAYKTILAMPGEEGDTLRAWEALQKPNALKQLDETIADIHPEKAPIANAVDNGKAAADAFTDVIEKNRAELGPKIGYLKKIDSLSPEMESFISDLQAKGLKGNLVWPPTEMEATANRIAGVIRAITDPDAPHGNVNLSKMIDTTDLANIRINPYDTGWGIDRQTYKNVKTLIQDLQKPQPLTLDRLFNLRKAVVENIDVLKTGDASSQLTKVKAGMMDAIQDEISQVPDFAFKNPADKVNIRDFFRRYAINEENANLIEKKFGAEIGTGNFRSLAKGKAPEDILNKIFRDSETVKAAKAILPEDKFNEILANHLAAERQAATDLNRFSSNKFARSTLIGNESALATAFDHMPIAPGTNLKPGPLQRIEDLVNIMRILPDSPPVNPSGTAKTLVRKLFDGVLNLSPKEILFNLAGHMKDTYAHNQIIGELNQELAGNAQKVNTVSKLNSMIAKATKQIGSAIGNVLESKATKIVPAAPLTPDEYKKTVRDIKSMLSNPKLLHDKISNATQPLYGAAPNTAQALQKNLLTGVGFLGSKIPPQPQNSLLQKTPEPTKAEIAKFDKYYRAVQNPLEVLHQLSNHTLSSESLEAVKTVYPKIYMKMQQELLGQISDNKESYQLPYTTKMSVGKFLDAPVHGSQTPTAIMNNLKVYMSSHPQGPQQPPNHPSKIGTGKITLPSRMSLRPKD